jgi:hypothetical protein
MVLTRPLNPSEVAPNNLVFKRALTSKRPFSLVCYKRAKTAIMWRIRVLYTVYIVCIPRVISITSITLAVYC